MKRSELIFSAITLPLDYLTLIVAAVSAYSIRYLPATQKVRPVIFDLPFQNFLPIVSLIAMAWIIIFAISGLYTMRGARKIGQEISKIFIACSAGLALVLAYMVFSRFLFDSRFIILVAWLFAIIFISFERLIIRLLQRVAFRFGIGVHRIIVVGNGQIAKKLAEIFLNRPALGFKVVGQIDNFNETEKIKLEAMAKEDSFDEIVQVNPNLSLNQTTELVDFVNEYHLTYKYTADLLDTQLTNLEVSTLSGVPIVEVKQTRLDGWGRIYKRVFDIIGSIILIALFSPVMLVIAVMIKFDSRGPIFFRYKRIGQEGKPFTYFKFRSMIKDAHKYRFDQEFLASHKNLRDGSPMIKFKDDPRITRVGKLLRRFSLDELSEFFLVLTGHMSLVGPRPHEVEEVERYQKHHKKVLTIKPGITGMAQVSGRSDLDFEEEVKLDTYYIENWSLGRDLQILFKTPAAIIKRRKTE
jgi:exopolysaccharide biosynthesis polyprenyl glycosylphosphotransferase